MNALIKDVSYTKRLQNMVTLSIGWDEFSRIEAAKRLSKFEKQINIPTHYSDSLWDELTKDASENLHHLKQNIKERLIPSITQSGDKENIQKVHSIIEKFAEYLLNPTVVELKGLNESISKLEPKIEKATSPFLVRYPHLRLPFSIIGFIFCGTLVSYLSVKFMNVTNDTALLAGVGVFTALCALYVGIVKSK